MKDYGPQKAKKKWPISLGYTFRPSANYHREKWRQWSPKKANRKCVKDVEALCTFWLSWKTQKIHATKCFTNNDKSNSFSLFSPKLDIPKCGIYVATCVICHEQYVRLSVVMTVNKRSWAVPQQTNHLFKNLLLTLQ